ncbi:cytochrome oxidase subunit III [Chloroflexia bacterium SDU3-3]|nr:cytochrome oxidase subunit III [Chloroflexia bacterium SDU3-3]
MSELTTAHAPAAHGSAHGETSLGVDSRKLGIWAFLGSETMFFGALIVTYLIYKPVNAARSDAQLPHEMLGINFTALLAAILLASSLTMVLSLASIRKNDQKWFTIWLAATAGLGLCFLGGQVYEFTHLYHEGLTLSSSLLGTTFFVLTGFHGTHVAIGVAWLLSVLFRSRTLGYNVAEHMDVELVGLYWHFVDLVWVAVFTLIYLLP